MIMLMIKRLNDDGQDEIKVDHVDDYDDDKEEEEEEEEEEEAILALDTFDYTKRRCRRIT
jgi:hypothetical protein